MRHLLAVTALTLTSACFDFDSDLLRCQNEGRCSTSNAGGGIGFPGGGTGFTGGGTAITGGGTGFTGGGTGFTGGGTGFTGGGTGFTGGGTGFTGGGTAITGGGTAVTGGGTGITGGGLNTSCATFDVSGFGLPDYLYNPEPYDRTTVTLSRPPDSIRATVRWAQNPDIPITNHILDGGSENIVEIEINTQNKFYSLLLGNLAIAATRGYTADLVATVTDGYFYNESDRSDCIYSPLLSIDTSPTQCEILPAFTHDTTTFNPGGCCESTLGNTSNDAGAQLSVRASWMSSYAETGLVLPLYDAGIGSYSNNNVSLSLGQPLPDGGYDFYRGSSGTVDLIVATRGDGGSAPIAFDATLHNVQFFTNDQTRCVYLQEKRILVTP